MSGHASLWLVRHGETEWSASGKHTGRTDVPLNAKGIRRAAALSAELGERSFAAVLTSPLSRARETCRIAGLGDRASVDPDLMEWDYGVYEGKTTSEIRRREGSDWSIWSSAVNGGEDVRDVEARALRVIERVSAARGDVVLFSHGHFLRILAATWLGLPAESGRLFGLDTGALSILGYEREARVIRLWNYVGREQRE